KFERRRFVGYDRDLAYVRFDPRLWRQLGPPDREGVRRGGPHCLDQKLAFLRYTSSRPRGGDTPAGGPAGLLLPAGPGCGTSAAPGETEVGSAGEQPTKG